jgi:CHAD domain-containing protein
VASRRLRELLPILQLDSNLARKLSQRLREVTRRLGAVRELDVLVMVLDDLRESERFDEASLAAVADAIAGEQEEARKRLRCRLSTSDLRRLAAKLAAVSQRLETAGSSGSRRGEKAWQWALDARIASRADRLDRAMREAGAVYLPDRLHAVRIAVKKLRYALELRAAAAGVKKDQAIQALKRAQDALGTMHDLQLLMDRVRHVQASLTQVDAREWDKLDAMVEGIEDDCRRLHARYMRMRPALNAVCAQSVARAHPAGGRHVGGRAAAG